VTSIPDLTAQDGHLIAMLELSIYESMVVGHLRRAVGLLGRDASFSEAQRREMWRTWQTEATQSLDGALRYREREPLVLTVAVTADLIPGLYPHAKTISYYAAMRGLITNAKRRWSPKTERRRRALPLSEVVVRMPVWVLPEGTLEAGQNLTPAQHAALLKRGGREVWGVAFHHHLIDWRAVLHRVRGALPIVTCALPDEEIILVAPVPPLW
jgi:hypothetical protein